MRVRVAAEDLEQVIRACFGGLGLSEQDCQAVADALVYANLRGIDSHGVNRVPVYMRRVHAGLAAGSEKMTVLATRGALWRLDAGHALGPAAAVVAVDRAIALASEFGVGLVALGNATNFGAAGYYALRAAEQGRVAIVAGNAPKMMAPHGARDPFLGSNPLAIGIPMGDDDEFLLDMSSTVAARGKLRRAQALGERIPAGLALGPGGEPTTDPAVALAGVLLPFAGAKGTGLALAIALLAGLLAGADFDDEVASIYGADARPQNLGQLFIAIDPWAVADREQAQARLQGLVERLHALAADPSLDAPRYAGEGSARRARRARSEGIALELTELQAVARACNECGLPRVAVDVETLIERGRGS